MAFVTLTSDLGTSDHYVAAIKGSVYSHCGNITITDVTHQIKPYDIKQAAYVIGQAYSHFPKGTIHVVHVNTRSGKSDLLIAKVNDHYFLTFDNGILSLIFGQTPNETYQVNDELLESNSLLYDIAIARVVELLTKEYHVTDFAHIATQTTNYRSLQPITSPGNIKGSILYIDHYGNAVFNVTQDLFEQFIGLKSFTIAANVGSTKILSKSYSDADEGDVVCFFNSAGYLELGINKGNAAQLLGLKNESFLLIYAD